MPVWVTAISLSRTGIDHAVNRFKLISQAAPTPSTNAQTSAAGGRYRLAILATASPSSAIVSNAEDPDMQALWSFAAGRAMRVLPGQMVRPKGPGVREQGP